MNAMTKNHSKNADQDLVTKVRWSIRQRLRFQMQHLSAEFFDQVDDYLFAGTQQGHLGNDTGFLRCMREIRTKQGLFEETFLRTVMSTIEEAEVAEGTGKTNLAGQSSQREVIYESLEIDLALQAMARKAERHYLKQLKQIVSIDQNLQEKGQGAVIPHDILIRATLEAFTVAQNLLSMNLEVRLVFIKLFEKHFLLQMEKLFAEIISILKNIDNDAFVEKLVSSSSAIEKRNTEIQRASKSLTELVLGKPENAGKSQEIDSQVDAFICQLIQDKSLPAVLEKLIDETWRAVMSMVGFNRGCDSIEWNETKHTITLLVTAVDDGLQLSASERAVLTEQLQHGFKLTHVNKELQQHYFTELEKLFEANANSHNPVKRNITATQPAEASVSPAGEEILDREDLDEIAMMLCGESGEDELDSDSVQKQFEDYLMEIDMLQDDARVDFQISGEFKPCTLRKNSTNTDLFSICNKAAKVAVPRSRLGLAISLKSGELRIPDQRAMSVVAQNTLLEAPTPKSIN